MTLLLVLASATAGTGGGVFNTGLIHWSANFRFPPAAADITNMQTQITQASQDIWDATEGQLRYGTVTFTCGARNEDAADMWIFPQGGRAGLQTYIDGSNARRSGMHVTQFLPDSTSFVVAHEMAHQMFGLLDEYDEQPRGIGPCIDAANQTETAHCLMDGRGAVSETEFCVSTNHDPRRGEGTPCTPGAAPNPAACMWYDPTTSRWEATDQEQFLTAIALPGSHDCWTRLVANFPFLTAPAIPAAASPVGWVAPTFVDNCTATTSVMLVLDRSGSMGWHPSSDSGEVCGNGFDDDGDGTVDETTTAGGCADSRMAFLQAAARGYIALANNRGQRVGVMSFSDLPSPDVGMQALDNSTRGAFDTAITNLMPGGGTGIGRALTSAAGVLTGESAGARTAFLISDGHNTVGEAPETVVPTLQAAGIRVFTISTGDASNDPTLGTIASRTTGAPLDAHDSRTLVNAFIRQHARANNDGTLIPLFPYRLDPQGQSERKENSELPRRSPASWVEGVDQELRLSDYRSTNAIFSFQVEEGTERISIALAGDMDDMDGFGVEAVLEGPDSTRLDTLAPDPSMTVVRDGYFVLVDVKEPKPGTWSMSVESAAGADPLQSGHVTVITENPMVDLFTDLDRRVVEDASAPVHLTILPVYLTGVRDPEAVTASVLKPDGEVKLLDVALDPLSPDGVVWSADIDDLSMAGSYEVRVHLRTGANSNNDPGEAIFEKAPSAAVHVPIFERTVTETFVVRNGTFPCIKQGDCDGDCISESPREDADGDNIPDDHDLDADNDELPDAVEVPRCEPGDADTDGAPDHLDPDADNDTTPDGSDNCRLVGNDQADDDRDGFGDACDNCPSQPNADQVDGDADGMGDLCDAAPNDPVPDCEGCRTAGSGLPFGLAVAMALTLRRRRVHHRR